MADLAVKAIRLAAGSADGAGLAASAGMLTAGTDLVSPLASSTDASRLIDAHPSSTAADLRSPRGPPASSFRS